MKKFKTKTKQNKTKQNKTKQNKTKQNRKKFLKRIFGGEEFVYDKNSTNDVETFINKITNILNETNVIALKIMVNNKNWRIQQKNKDNTINDLRNELNKGTIAIFDESSIERTSS